MPPEPPPCDIASLARHADINVSDNQFLRLSLYVSLLCQWQSRINLIAPSTIPDIWTRHIADALQLCPLLPADSTPLQIIDLGSGGGLPAIPLAICTAHHFHLVESDRRKSIFLEETARQLSMADVSRETCPQITVHTQRIESLSLPPADIITSRACAPLTQLLALSSHLRDATTLCLFPKGKNYSKEIEAARAIWSFDLEIIASKLHSGGAILKLCQVQEKA